MNEWILIVILITSSPSVSVTVVKSEAACESAMAKLDVILKATKLRALVACAEMVPGETMPPAVEEPEPKPRKKELRI